MSDPTKTNARKNLIAVVDNTVAHYESTDCIAKTIDSPSQSIIAVVTDAIRQSDFNINAITDSIIAENQRILLLSRGIVLRAVTIGDQLLLAKSKLDHGAFHEWLKTTLGRRGLKTRTAQRYMKMAENYTALLERVAEEHEEKTGEKLATEDAKQIVKGMSMRSANSLLSRSKPNEAKIVERRIVANVVVRKSGHFFGCSLKLADHWHQISKATHVSCWVPASEIKDSKNGVQRKVLLVPTHQRHNKSIVREAIKHFSIHRGSSQLLLLNSHSIHDWLPALDRFARLEMRVHNSGAKHDVYRVFHVATSDSIPQFSNAFAELGPVFIPFTTTTSKEDQS